MAKYRQHHEERFNRYKIAEERNAKERQHKRAQLVQQLAQLDSLVSNILEHLAEIPLCAQPLMVHY